MSTIPPPPDDALESEYRNQKKQPAKPQQDDESSGAGDTLETVVDVAEVVVGQTGCLWWLIKIPFRLIGAIWGIFSD